VEDSDVSDGLRAKILAIKALRWRVLTVHGNANVNVLEMATPLLKLLVTILEQEGLAKSDVLEGYAFLFSVMHLRMAWLTSFQPQGESKDASTSFRVAFAPSYDRETRSYDSSKVFESRMCHPSGFYIPSFPPVSRVLT